MICFLQRDFILKYCLTIYSERIGDNNIEVNLDDFGDNLINTRKNQMTSIFLNVLDNSIYWLSKTKNPKIKISSFIENDHLIIIFSDNGPGFGNVPHDMLIEPYYTRKPDGIGLGLFLVDMLMTRLNGELRFDDERYSKYYLDGASVILRFKKEVAVDDKF